MIVVTIIAILCALGITAYQQYVTRAQVSEGFSLAGAARDAIAIHYANSGAFPGNNFTAGLAMPASISGQYVQSVTIGADNGSIGIAFGPGASAALSGQVLTFQAIESAGSLSWNCSGLPRRYLPASCL